MLSKITIAIEKQYHGCWLKIFIPYSNPGKTLASIQNSSGSILKDVQLSEGNNAIDISQVQEDILNIKVETPAETVSKKIKINSF